MTVKEQLFVSHIDVVYGDQPSQAPCERVRVLDAQDGESDNINYRLGGKYVWLVPRYTTERSAAVVGFEVVIQGGADESLQDLTHGADSKFRYILPVKDVTNEAKVTQVALYRLNEDMKTRPDGWAGCTSNISKDRDTVTLLYLVWKTATST